MDTSLTENEGRLYSVWLHSRRVSSPDPVETILDFKIARVPEYPGSKVLKLLRALPGLDPERVQHVRSLVDADPRVRCGAR